MHYRDANTTVSVYIFRPALTGGWLWFDQSVATLAANPRLNADPRTLRPRDVTAGGADNRSGRMLSLAVNGNGYRSTGLAIVPHGEWLVKLRASSGALDQSGIEALMRQTLSEIRFTREPGGGALRQVDNCAERFATAATAREARPNPQLMAQVTADLLPSFQQYRAQPLCREAQQGYVGVYHGAEQRDGYLLAIGDSGRVARVRQVGGTSGPYVAEFYDLTTAYIAGFFETLPAPAQVIEVSGRAMQSGGLGRVSLGTSSAVPPPQGVPTT